MSGRCFQIQKENERGFPDAIQSSAGADSERQNQHAECGDASLSKQSAGAKANVLSEIVQPGPAPDDVTFFAEVGGVADATPSRGLRVFRRHAVLELFQPAQFEVQAHFFFEFGVKSAAMQQHIQPPSQFTQPVHAGTPFPFLAESPRHSWRSAIMGSIRKARRAGR
jgi:hypothetical protein